MNRPGLRASTGSVRDPGRDTLRQTIENLHDAVQEAARLEAAALSEFQAIDPNGAGEAAARGWLQQSRIEKAHWRTYLSAYQIHLEAHPELADKPLGTRCAHGPHCLIGSPLVGPGGKPMRDVGADDGEPAPAPAPSYQDSRLPPEIDQETLPF